MPDNTQTRVSLCTPSELCSTARYVTKFALLPAGSTPNSVSTASIAAAKSLTIAALAFVLPGFGASTSVEALTSNAPGYELPDPNPNSLIYSLAVDPTYGKLLRTCPFELKLYNLN